MSTLVVSLVSETSKTLPTILTLERSFSCVCPKMHFKVPLFGKAFVATFDRAKIFSLRSDTMFIRFVDPQPILSCESLLAEPAMKESWIAFSPNWRWNYVMVFHHLKMIASTFWKIFLENSSFLVTWRMRRFNGTTDASWFFGIILVLFLLRFEVFFFFNLFGHILNPKNDLNNIIYSLYEDSSKILRLADWSFAPNMNIGEKFVKNREIL